MVTNRFKVAKMLREVAEVQAVDGMLSIAEENALFDLGVLAGSDVAYLERRNRELAKTERVILCLLGAHVALDRANKVSRGSGGG